MEFLSPMESTLTVWKHTTCFLLRKVRWFMSPLTGCANLPFPTYSPALNIISHLILSNLIGEKLSHWFCVSLMTSEGKHLFVFLSTILPSLPHPVTCLGWSFPIGEFVHPWLALTLFVYKNIHSCVPCCEWCSSPPDTCPENLLFALGSI